ncbi:MULTISPECIES: carbohydrate ABC transporter permease [Pasteurellaceae]|uniref:Sugar ABC transporter permease n=1 Tax=Pasteurella atlantica TaxID=2827233 RepID=A0AAW8CT36_9PAST|nr:sugar ABC transporter permease [Pasteurella atlantica]MBR0574653.1 sugar ABC transporter permease [Pasteurella atlantica]MDP8040565.1 sugar ABC transporter permease [Pasteurella atlantica]MDP8042696.1 sugar ABC transporter permease [Pasteurella atlantica]MDP8044783.1 sugar ABC transporter permease [Pasteurella atlantica]MDP8046880.1 sugar ABC transporter permease [Pasteurella atlantica]
MIKIFNNKKFGKQLFIFSFLLPTLLCFFIFYFYSVATIFVTSFTKWDYTNLSHPEFLGFDNLFANYHYIFKEYPFFMEALFNSIRWAIIGIVIQVPIAVSIAIILSKKLSGWKVTRNLFIIPSIISSAAMGLIFLQIYNPNYGVVNEIIKFFNPDFNGSVLLIPGVNIVAMTAAYVFFTGASTIMVLGQILAIPKSLYEAAEIDGISNFKVDWYITLPMIKDTIKTISVMAASAGFLIYNEVFFLTNGAAGTKSISFIIRELAVSSSRTQYARANTVGVFQILGGLLIIVLIGLIFRNKDNKLMK